MKIGIITFHWATNYGAVLQAYALQNYLIKAGNEVHIIDYVPATITVKQHILAIKNGDFAFFKQEQQLKQFRRQHLRLTDRKYLSHKSLIKKEHDFDCVIAGSDQIWNESFTLHGEGKVTLSYFLDFVKDEVRRVGYAVSFGFVKPSNQYIDAVKGEIKKFSAISVRETDGVNIVSTFGLKSFLVCDPTALLEKSDYLSVIGNRATERGSVFAYILRENQVDAWNTAKYVGEVYKCDIKTGRYVGSMEEWIVAIHDAKFVITNSFHGVMLSIIMNTPFIALTIKGSGMNSRITTLLESVGLSSRILETYSEEMIQEIMANEIDWVSVNNKFQKLRYTGVKFLQDALYDDNL